ncbi:MAG: hypothetical protein KKB59_18700 [Spirochaetes bacterium]|nr:hypothetical protein [Spirochaetota bacterium]
MGEFLIYKLAIIGSGVVIALTGIVLYFVLALRGKEGMISSGEIKLGPLKVRGVPFVMIGALGIMVTLFGIFQGGRQTADGWELEAMEMIETMLELEPEERAELEMIAEGMAAADDDDSAELELYDPDLDALLMEDPDTGELVLDAGEVLDLLNE